MAEEWGPWIEHDGKGCPVKGRYVRSEDFTGFVSEHIAHTLGDIYVGDAWAWDTVPDFLKKYCVRRYRVRKPRGLTILEEILADLPEKVDA